ncbi:hypothetical protein [Streptomyces sp. NPDC058989]|uniref:hypothetical protein n=1 Tax=Streptomyces sp. NPDC058989 TaxID=3346686 RepID=UPI0036AEAE74
MPSISLGDHDEIGIIALTSNDAPAAVHTLLTDHGFWRPRGIFGYILIHDRHVHDIPARIEQFLAAAARQGIGVEYHLPRFLPDSGSPAAGERIEELWRDNQAREYRRSLREATRIAPRRGDLETLACDLARRLPGEWTVHVDDFAEPGSQLDFFDALWDNACLTRAWMGFRVPRAVILTGPSRLQLVVIDRPLHHGQILVGALALHGIDHEFFGDDNAPHAIAAPAEAARAAHTVTRRLLPRYHQAAHRLVTNELATALTAGQQALDAWDTVSASLRDDQGRPLDKETYRRRAEQRDAEVWDTFRVFLDHAPALLESAGAAAHQTGGDPQDAWRLRQLRKALHTGQQAVRDWRLEVVRTRVSPEPDPDPELSYARTVADRNAEAWHAMTEWLAHGPALLRLTRPLPPDAPAPPAAQAPRGRPLVRPH